MCFLARQLMSGHRLSPLACGQRAESRGGRGVLLCVDRAERHGLNQSKPQTGAMTLSIARPVASYTTERKAWVLRKYGRPWSKL